MKRRLSLDVLLAAFLLITGSVLHMPVKSGPICIPQASSTLTSQVLSR